MAAGLFRGTLILVVGALLGVALARLEGAPAAGDSAGEAAPPLPPAPWGAMASGRPAGPAARQHSADQRRSDQQPPGSLAEILQIDGEFAQTAALYSLAAEADAGALETLIVEAEFLPGSADRGAALSILYARYADLDPAAALDFLNVRGTTLGNSELMTIFHSWSRADLDAALAAAEALDPELRRAAGTAILRARDDLAGAARSAIAARLELESVLGQLELRERLGGVNRDPAFAWQEALRVEDRNLRQQALNSVVRVWARQDPRAALEAVAALGATGHAGSLMAQIVNGWAQQEPGAALDWVLAQPPSAGRRQALSMALAGLAAHDPQRAFEVADTLSGRDRSQSLGAVLSAWGQQDPAAAAAALSNVTDRSVRSQALMTIAMKLAGQQPEAAARWLDGLPPRDALQATGIVFMVLTQQDPRSAAARALDISDPSARRVAAHSVARTWAEADAPAAARWVDTLVDAEAQREATSAVVQRWAEFDPEAAERYAQSLPASAGREQALVALLQRRGEDLAHAERIFEQLTEPSMRQAAAGWLYHQLRRVDPVRAERYQALADQNVESRQTR